MEKKTFYITLALLVTLLIGIPSFVQAATLSVTPASGTYSIGERATIRVVVSGETPLNAITGTLSFPADLFAIESVSKSSSILNFWIAEPSFSKQSGVVQFEGVALSGFQGGSGTVLTVNARAIKTGSGNITFKSGQILANDGQGTDITSGLQGGVYVIESAPVRVVVPDEIKEVEVVPEEVSVVQPTLNAPQIVLGEQDGLVAIQGTSRYSKSDVILTFISSNGSKVFITGLSDGSGNFSLIVPQALKNGPYSVTAIMVLSDGSRSAPSETLVVEVGGVFYGNITWQTVAYALFAVALLLTLYMFISVWKKHNRSNRKLLNKEIQEAEKTVQKSFDLMREDLSSYKKSINPKQKGLVDSEIIDVLKKDLDVAQGIIEKEIEDIRVIPLDESK